MVAPRKEWPIAEKQIASDEPRDPFGSRLDGFRPGKPMLWRHHMRKMVSFKNLRRLLWMGAALTGFASAANAYVCGSGGSSCTCSNPCLINWGQGWHCCTDWCGDSAHPYCGTIGYYNWYGLTCNIACASVGCSEIDYYANGEGCKCGTCT